MATKRNQVAPISTKNTKTDDILDFFQKDEEVNYYVWTDFLKTDTNEDGEEYEYFDGSPLISGVVQQKTVKDDPSADYHIAPISCRYITAKGEVVGNFYFELPEKEFPYGVSSLPSRGKLNWSLMCRFNKNDEQDVRFMTVFSDGMRNWFGEQAIENNWCTIAGADEERIDRETPIRNIRAWIRFPKDKMKQELKDRDKQWYISMLNQRDEKTVITTPVQEGQKPKPIDWNKLKNVGLYMIVTVQCLSVYLGGGKVSPQLRAVSAIITRPPKRGGRVVNMKTANRLAKENPGLSVNINLIIDSIEVDNPSNSENDGFVSSVTVKTSTKDNVGDDDDNFTLSAPKGKAKASLEGFMNSAKKGPNKNVVTANKPGVKGPAVASRKPVATPSKLVVDLDNDEESYE